MSKARSDKIDALSADEVGRWLRPLIRQRTMLVPGASSRDDSLLATRFGGVPTGRGGERWPICDRGHLLSFVAQVNHVRDARHSPTLGIAFFTFFYCWDCGPLHPKKPRDGIKEREGFRVMAYPSLSPSQACELRLEPDASKGYRWQEFEPRFVIPRLEQSLPDDVGFEVHCPPLWDRVPGNSGARQAWENWHVVDRVASELTHAREKPHSRNRGVVLGGYPNWVNGPDQTPRCTVCGELMELLLQLSPSDVTDASWGDVWTAYLFMCRTHLKEVALRFQGT